jgi:hypothetical protein
VIEGRSKRIAAKRHPVMQMNRRLMTGSFVRLVPFSKLPG